MKTVLDTMQEETHTCKECGKTFLTLGRHLSFSHKMTYEDYVIKWEHDNVRPVCKCGCGEAVTFYRGSFKLFVHGHANRDESVRKKMIDGGTVAARDPEKQKKNSQALLAKWQELNFRQKCLESLKRSAPVRHANITEKNRSAENRERSRKRKKEWWAQDENRDQMEKIFATPQFKERVSIGTRKGLDNPEIRRKLSETACRSVMAGKIKAQRSKKSWHVNPCTGERECHDSSWETLFVQESLRRQIPVAKNKHLRISYNDYAGNSRTYIPDFLTLSNKTIIEIKGYETVLDACKFVALEEYCLVNGLNYVIFRSKKEIMSDDFWKNMS